MSVKELLSLFPDEFLSELSIETNVDRYAKKLTGRITLKLLLFSVLNHKDNSLRRMEALYNSMSRDSHPTISISSLSERLSKINVDFFRKLYYKSVELYGGILERRSESVIRYDSTIISLSSKLLNTGYELKGGDASHLRQLKFTIGHSTIPVVGDFYKEQRYTSENVALRETIEGHQGQERSIRVFDRGITSRKTYDDWIGKAIQFVSRISAKSKMQVVKSFELADTKQTPTLVIGSDQLVFLFGDKGRKSKSPIRCIKAIQKESGEELVFITNKMDLSAVEITQIYKSRWDIEVFFKFIKQELNFSHLVNRSANGIEVMLYITLIASILLIVYKESNGLKGYKIMKQKFLQELEWETIKDIVAYCGGDIQKMEEIRHDRFIT